MPHLRKGTTTTIRIKQHFGTGHDFLKLSKLLQVPGGIKNHSNYASTIAEDYSNYSFYIDIILI